MASEPKHDADDLLKRYAEERRRQAAPELHPATRRLLQGEVARTYGSNIRGATPWWRKILVSPQVGWALGLALVAGVSFLALRQPKPQPKTEQSVELKKESAPAPVDVPTQSEAPASAAAPPPAIQEPEREVSVIAPVATAPAPSGAVNPVKREEAQNRARVAELKTKAVAPMPVRAVAEKASDAVELRFSNQSAIANSTRNNDGGRGGFGGNNYANNDVLNQFTIQQTGGRLNVRDQDGSSYTGQVVALSSGTNSFRAIGTNVTLQQSVDFTGQLYRAVAPTRQRGVSQQVPLAKDQMRVQGRATIGRTNQIQIDAQTVAPAR